MISVGVIGCGHWGPNHIRIFQQLSDSRVVICSDKEEERLKAIQGIYPGIAVTQEAAAVIQHPEVDTVCIATPTDTHYTLAREALVAGKHVFCEKPLALTPQECVKLKGLADEHQRLLMVGHIFLFNPGIIWMKDYIQSGELGRIQYAHSERTNLGPFRYDVNALWDLAPHDISIFNYLFDSAPLNASARGHRALGTSLEDLAFACMEYPDEIMVNIHVSWLDPKKVRQITIVGDKKMIVWDDLDNLGPIRVYDKHVEITSKFYETYGEFQLLSREGNITIPKIDFQEPLKVQARYFLDCLINKRPPEKADAQKGYDVVRTLCAIQRSMDEQGRLVALKEVESRD